MKRKRTDRQGIDILKNYFSRFQIADEDGDLDRDPYNPAAWQNNTLSNGATGTIDWVVTFGLPEIPKFVFLKIDVRDSASAGGAYRFQMKAKNTTTTYSLDAWAERAANDAIRGTIGGVAVADNGTTYYGVQASGVNTMDVWIGLVAWIK